MKEIFCNNATEQDSYLTEQQRAEITQEGYHLITGEDRSITLLAPRFRDDDYLVADPRTFAADANLAEELEIYLTETLRALHNRFSELQVRRLFQALLPLITTPDYTPDTPASFGEHGVDVQVAEDTYRSHYEYTVVKLKDFIANLLHNRSPRLHITHFREKLRQLLLEYDWELRDTHTPTLLEFGMPNGDQHKTMLYADDFLGIRDFVNDLAVSMTQADHRPFLAKPDANADTSELRA